MKKQHWLMLAFVLVFLAGFGALLVASEKPMDMEAIAKARAELGFPAVKNQVVHGEDYPIVWEDAGMEALVRFLLNKPGGDILHSDVWDVQAFVISLTPHNPSSVWLEDYPEGADAFTYENVAENSDIRIEHPKDGFPVIQSLHDLQHFDNLAVFMFFGSTELDRSGTEDLQGLQVFLI